METPLTKEIKQALIRSCFAANNKSLAKVYGSLEVTVGFDNQRITPKSKGTSGIEVVDFMSYDRNTDIIRCYEIKVSAADLKSKCSLSFYGHLNYLVIPAALREQMGEALTEYIPEHAGIVVYDGERLQTVRTPKRVSLTPETVDILKNSLIRSLFYKAYKKALS